MPHDGLTNTPRELESPDCDQRAVASNCDNLQRANNIPPHLLARLTPQERRVLCLWVGEPLDEKVAGRLGVAAQTVRNHLTSILKKAESSLPCGTDEAGSGARCRRSHNGSTQLKFLGRIRKKMIDATD